jgi:hypothetical protein
MAIIHTCIPNGINIIQIAIDTNLFPFHALQNLPNRDFWFENIPSGNPGFKVSRSVQKTYFRVEDLLAYIFQVY